MADRKLVSFGLDHIETFSCSCFGILHELFAKICTKGYSSHWVIRDSEWCRVKRKRIKKLLNPIFLTQIHFLMGKWLNTRHFIPFLFRCSQMHTRIRISITLQIGTRKLIFIKFGDFKLVQIFLVECHVFIIQLWFLFFLELNLVNFRVLIQCKLRLRFLLLLEH